MKCIVTGVAGFIGSHLAERLVAESYEVVGIDCFTNCYSKKLKLCNLSVLLQDERFRFAEGDLLELDLRQLLKGVDYVFHEAAWAGVRESWGDDFEVYIRNNELATQRLLEAVKGSKLRRFIYASSSSVYGNALAFPIKEATATMPISPYGVTKLAGEHLCRVYCDSFGVPVTTLRYFSVFGPRQRPDMAFSKFIEAATKGDKVVVYGDGNQARDFTFVSDIVEANILAVKKVYERAAGSYRVYNIGGGLQVSVNGIVNILRDLIGNSIEISYIGKQLGDPLRTLADISRASKELGYQPEVGVAEGLRRQLLWWKKVT